MSERPPDIPVPPISRWLIGLSAVALLAVLTALFDSAAPGRRAVQRELGQGDGQALILQRQRNGHYLASGAINGVAVDFLVDTGATDVAVPQQLARELGLEFGPQVTVLTAAGPVPAWMTRLDRVSVGQLAVENVRGTITRAPLQQVLLGMSFLRHFRLSQQGDQLVIDSGA